MRPAIVSGSTMFSAAVSVGSRLKVWKMKPILSRRSCVSARSLSVGDLLAVDPHVAGRGLVEAGEDVHQRRLAGAGRAHDRRVRAALEVDVDPRQRAHERVSLAVVPLDAACLDDGVL